MIVSLKCGAKEWEYANQGKFMNKNITEIFWINFVVRFIQDKNM